MRGRPNVARPDEVLAVLTEVLRTETPEPALKPADRFKAAELLGKHYGLFEAREEESAFPAEAAAAVEAAVRAVRDE